MLYSDTDSAERWATIVKRQSIRDSVFLPTLEKYLVPGSVHEVGAACGQLAQFFLQRGRTDVVASDLEPGFVRYMQSKGLTAHVVDATNIQACLPRTFDNVVSQGLTVQMSVDDAIADKTYRSIYESMRPGGRYVSICGNYDRRGVKHRHAYRTISQHLEAIRRSPFRLIAAKKHQVLSPAWYREWNKVLFNRIDHWGAHIAANRFIFVLER